MRFLLLSLLPFALASAQPAAPDTAARRKAMEKLAFIAGDWAGEASAMMGPNNFTRMWQTEWVRYKLNGQILVVEGVARRLAAAGLADTAFAAWATIDWAPERGYVMRSTTLEGRTGEFPLEVSDSGFVWNFTFPAGRVRYTMRLTPAGEWYERGEYTRDGTQWFPTMQMRLKRAAPSVPAAASKP
jgi:hypothetical protein